MSSLYPTLEDMKVDQIVQAQQTYVNQVNATHHAIVASCQPPGAATYPPPVAVIYPQGGALYPSLTSYMGMEITPQMMQDMQVAVVNQSQVVAPRALSSGGMQVVAPVTGNSVGLARAEIKQGVREVALCKDGDGKIGLRVKAVNKGVFVAFVHANSPSALVGLRFGDQILQINGENVAGWDTDKTSNFIKKAMPQRINMAIRDRPFERTITLQKDSLGTVGFVFKENKITAIVKDSSAARNGVLIEHHMVEVNGQNVIGLKEKEIKAIFDAVGRTVTITIVPTVIYEHIMKNIGSGLIRKSMDHSVPDL
jgi:syntenin-1